MSGMAAVEPQSSVPPKILPSVCPLDCPDACSLEVHVEGDRVVAVGGSRVNPVTEGYICAKVRRLPEHVHGERRVRYPAVREGRKGEGRFRRVSWDEALDTIAARMTELVRRGDSERILPFYYGGSNGYLSQNTSDLRLFTRLGASRLARTVCAAPSGSAVAGLYGTMPGIALQDYSHSRLIVLWGVNPSVSGIHIVPHVLEAQSRGARLVVVDPRRTRLAERADLHIAPQPGTDLPVALALIRWLFENGRADEAFLAAHATGAEELRRRAEPWTLERAARTARVPEEDLEAFARLYADSRPAAIRCGWGLERNRNGGSAVAAVLALPAVAGKFGARGGGYTLSNSKAWDLEARNAAGELPANPAREVNMNLLGRTLLGDNGPPVELLFVYNANPLATIPNQAKVREGLSRDDLFTIVFDPVLTDTALYADVLLPATTFLERDEMSRGYGAMVLQESAPVIAPVGESRPNHEVFSDLTRRCGLARAGDPESAAEMKEAILRGSRAGASIRESLDRSGIAFPAGNPALVQFEDTFPLTADRKIHLVPLELDREAPHGLYAFAAEEETGDYPLTLISPASDRTISSTLGELHEEQVPLEMAPSDASARGMGDGDEVRVFNDLGEVRCLVSANPSLREGVVMLPKGLWSHNTLSGTGATALAPDSLTDLGGGACFNDARVEVRRIGPGVATSGPLPRSA
jgi:anaerobic selenocysteine-containing dehydrogenase